MSHSSTVVTWCKQGACAAVSPSYLCVQVATLPSLKVRYDSSEALYLRKALNPSFAPHRAILRQSANPSEHKLLALDQLPMQCQQTSLAV
jgi:hypothetical protein